MGIVFLPHRKYECSECGCKDGYKYSESARPEKLGTYEGIRCPNCKHETRHYVPSISEMESSSGNIYSNTLNGTKKF